MSCKGITGARSNFPAYEISQIGRENCELRAEIGRLNAVLASIHAFDKKWGAAFIEPSEPADMKKDKSRAFSVTVGSPIHASIVKLAEVARIRALYEGHPCHNKRHPDDAVVLYSQHGKDEVSITLGNCRAAKDFLANGASKPRDPKLSKT